MRIDVSHPDHLVAPALIWLEATDHTGLAAFEHSGSIYDGALHEYHHEWVIDGEPLSPWSKVENLPASMNDPNRAFGKEVAFVLPAAGTYTISLTVTDRLGNTATARTDALTVIGPEEYYRESERIYVDPEGIWAGAPDDATKVRTLGEARLACPSYDSGEKPPWILLRGDVEHDMDTVAQDTAIRGSWRNSSEHAFGYLSSYGGGRARIVPSAYASRRAWAFFDVWKRPVGPGGHIIFTGIDFVGSYDPATERGVAGGVCVSALNSELQSAFVTLYDVDAYGVDQLFSGGAGEPSTTSWHAVADCDMPNGWRNYGSINDFSVSGVPTGKVAFLGNRLRQHPDALQGGDKPDAFPSVHGPIRIARAEYAYVAQNDLFSRNGWSADGPGKRADQPCLRMFTSTGESQGFVERNAMEGGYTTILASDANSRTRGPVNLVIENNLVVATAMNLGRQLQAGFSGVTFRNNLMVYPDTPKPTNNWGGATIRLNYRDELTTEDGRTSPFVVYNNTVLNLMSAANDRGKLIAFSEYEPLFTNVSESNNIHHLPNGTTPVTAQAPIDLATALSGFTPRFRGVRYGYDLAHFTPAADVGPGASFEVPYSAILKVLQDGSTVDGGGPTDQAYWQAIEDTDTRHAIYQRETRQRLWAELGQISVTFTATGARITNLTSDATLAAGHEIRVHLDRTSLIPPMDTRFASPATIPLPRPQPGSPAYQGATSGDVSRDDLYRVVRADPPSMGALEP